MSRYSSQFLGERVGSCYSGERLSPRFVLFLLCRTWCRRFFTELIGTILSMRFESSLEQRLMSESAGIYSAGKSILYLCQHLVLQSCNSSGVSMSSRPETSIRLLSPSLLSAWSLTAFHAPRRREIWSWARGIAGLCFAINCSTSAPVEKKYMKS